MSGSPHVTMLCDPCGKDRQFKRVTHAGAYTVRGQAITADLPMIACPVCGVLQPDPDHDPLVAIYNAYQRQTGLAHPKAEEPI